MTQVPQAATRTVIVRLRNFVGDVVLGIPALHLLEQHGYKPVLVGKAWAPALLEGQSWLVNVLAKGTRARAVQLRALRAQAQMGDPAFDARLNALVLPWSFGSALEMRLAGLRAVGYRHEARSLLLSRSWPMPAQSHALLNYWDLACRFLGIERPLPPAEIGLTPSPAQQELAEQLLARHGVHEPYVLICPFAAGDFDALSKTWPHFAEFARLAAARGLRLLVCPGPGEEQVAAERFPQALSLPGLNLGVYAALQRRATLVVSNDTGPGHLAAAAGARLLSVLGPTEPEHWAPWGSRVDVMRQHPGWWTPEQVLSRAEALMAGAAPSGGAWPHCLPPAASLAAAAGLAMGGH